MSSDKSTNVENCPFIDRFIEVCESDKAVKIKQLLNISDQAARNYLSGRLPTPEILITIADQTPYSIHWLLTGRGRKFVDQAYEKNALAVTDEMHATIREICAEVFAEFQQANQPKIVVLPPDRLKSEKAIEAPVSTIKKRS